MFRLLSVLGNDTIIYHNKYNCRDPHNAEAWLLVDKFNTLYMYPFQNMNHCRCETKNMFYGYVIFDNRRYPIDVGGYGFRTDMLKEKGIEWLQNNFKSNVADQNHVNNILNLPERDRRNILQRLTEEFISSNKLLMYSCV